MPIANTYGDLRKLSDAELIRQYDETAQSTQVGLNFLRDELARREAERQQEVMLRFTKQMRDMTIVITVLTAVNVIAVIIALFR